jgi:cytochrome c
MSSTLRLTIGAISGLVAIVLSATAPAFAATAAEGADAFQKKCATCHTADKGGKNGIGPNLFGIAGQKSGQVANFKYSVAFKAQQITWTDDKLKDWFVGPAKVVPGTKMILIKPVTPAEAESIVEFVKTKK